MTVIYLYYVPKRCAVTSNWRQLTVTTTRSNSYFSPILKTTVVITHTNRVTTYCRICYITRTESQSFAISEFVFLCYQVNPTQCWGVRTIQGLLEPFLVPLLGCSGGSRSNVTNAALDSRFEYPQLSCAQTPIRSEIC